MKSESEVAGTRSAEGVVEIAAAPSVVWRALTEARELERWFPLDARVEPGEGGTIWMSWRNEFAGTSRILKWDPPVHLRTTWGAWDDQEASQITDYWLEARGGGTWLRVITSGFPADAAWDDWVEGTRMGWSFELLSLRHYLEKHAGRDREVAYIRRRTTLPREEAWRRLFGPGLAEQVVGGVAFEADPPRQVIAFLDEPPGGLMRVSIEPTMPGSQERDVTVFLSAWGAPGATAAVAAKWRERLELAFPDGRWP